MKALLFHLSIAVLGAIFLLVDARLFGFLILLLLVRLEFQAENARLTALLRQGINELRLRAIERHLGVTDQAWDEAWEGLKAGSTPEDSKVFQQLLGWRVGSVSREGSAKASTNQ